MSCYICFKVGLMIDFMMTVLWCVCGLRGRPCGETFGTRRAIIPVFYCTGVLGRLTISQVLHEYSTRSTLGWMSWYLCYICTRIWRKARGHWNTSIIKSSIGPILNLCACLHQSMYIMKHSVWLASDQFEILVLFSTGLQKPAYTLPCTRGFAVWLAW